MHRYSRSRSQFATTFSVAFSILACQMTVPSHLLPAMPFSVERTGSLLQCNQSHIYIYGYVYKCIHINAFIHADVIHCRTDRKHAAAHSESYIHTYIHIYTHTRTYISTYTYTHIHANIILCRKDPKPAAVQSQSYCVLQSHNPHKMLKYALYA